MQRQFITDNGQRTTDKRQILIATKNVGKVRELEKLLEESAFNLRSLNEFPDVTDVKETGATFAENAVLKSREYSRKTNLWALADDSGLEVEVLDGAPGVFSARYAGENASDAEKIGKLLNELQEKDNRSARFVCVMALANETGEIIHLAEGICDGEISLSISGTNGFGYDPIFIPEGFTQTFGELSADVKRE
ncbi:MAG TPA: RdgB/HAM1 family non-canonical purine NTP pyrophosphatase, partial [Pyrinomonadaceae bacterium]|nr:RdgB/HAM1 family non-canonical purine NTP pyrophosphatase [Pyrinomonadaceae bacterium]